MSKILEVNNLRISFRTNNGRVKAVRGINFDLEKGETIAVVGESGSGKSVTARAIMGILAPNAIVEGGEILYDGKDLMKISEEEFHQLRGNRVAMIFQDPLSSLNPIVRIGKQLTEAMLLNGKASQKDAKKIFQAYTQELERVMLVSGVADAKAQIEVLKKFITESNKCERAYNDASGKRDEVLDILDDIKVDIAGERPKEVEKRAKELLKCAKLACNPFTIHEGNAEYTALYEDVAAKASVYAKTNDAADVLAAAEKLEKFVKSTVSEVAPNFFTLGYYLAFEASHKSQEELSSDVEAMNAMTRKYLDDNFMMHFIELVSKALHHSASESHDKRKKALVLARELQDYLEGDVDAKVLKAKGIELEKAVADSIDKLDIHKDSVAYTFKSAFNSAYIAYVEGMKLKAKKNLSKKERAHYENTDFSLLLENVKVILKRLIEDFDNKTNEIDHLDYAAASVRVIDYLKEEAAKMVYKVTKEMAKARAIRLMEEVGIPEAKKRYKQYPFEFSGGMRQRIVIAIALSANPDILICDEPTTALDVTIQSQILELINKIKEERQLSVIFITHDLGVVANMADKIAVMYAGQVVEYGLVDEIFYEPKHPYTWALLSSMPDLYTEEKLEAIPGTPPNMIYPPKGDAFAARNKYAMQIDFEEQPPMFKVSDTHYAATWLLHEKAPKVEPPAIVTERIARMKRLEAAKNE